MIKLQYLSKNAIKLSSSHSLSKIMPKSDYIAYPPIPSLSWMN